IDDSDLFDGNLPKGGGDGSGSNGKTLAIHKDLLKPFFFFFSPPGSQGAIAGIASAVIATVIGAVSSFIAYQKKKLCFKQSGKNS
ncbi:C99L2 protein, partial [Eubucco bourcierii]|nr:C99L2 protein [Eubucco bourcierii]